MPDEEDPEAAEASATAEPGTSGTSGTSSVGRAARRPGWRRSTPSARRPPADGWAPFAALAAAFVASRAAYAAAGVRFDAEPLFYLVQLVEPTLLTDRMAESLWYFHSQPPGFNLLVGVTLRWSPFPEAVSLQVVYLAFGALLLWALYDVARTLGVPRWGAVTAAVVIGCAPVVVLYENWLSYEYPVAAMLVALVAAVARWVRTAHLRWLVAVVALACACVLFRSLLHPLWLAGVVGVAVLARRPPRWSPAVVLTLVLPVLVVGGLMVKNQVLFGTPQLSSWFPYNVHQVAVGGLSETERERLRDEGILVAPIWPEDCARDRPDVEVLARTWQRGERGAEQIENPNDECRLLWYSQLGDDARATLDAEPRAVARNVAGSAVIWVTPGSLYFSLLPNRAHIEGADTLYRHTVLGDVPWSPPIEIPSAWAVLLSAPDERHHLSLTLVAATMVVLAGGAAAALRWRREGLSPARTVVVVAAGTVGFVAVSSILFEHGENNRIRWLTEPLTLVVALGVAVWAVRWVLARRRSSG
ncbi:MAG: hypothetical protein JJU45_09105 [Acidimicrobiia bacterium]|nr:hypothetical protein [Acidimicrobiia bacterium]